jgi:hypothetical protein
MWKQTRLKKKRTEAKKKRNSQITKTSRHMRTKNTPTVIGDWKEGKRARAVVNEGEGVKGLR